MLHIAAVSRSKQSGRLRKTLFSENMNSGELARKIAGKSLDGAKYWHPSCTSVKFLKGFLQHIKIQTQDWIGKLVENQLTCMYSDRMLRSC